MATLYRCAGYCSGGVRADSWPSWIDVWVIVVVELELIHGHAV